MISISYDYQLRFQEAFLKVRQSIEFVHIKQMYKS